MKPHDKRIQALARASKAKRAATLVKVNDAMKYMREHDLSINFNSVAEVAGVSKTWLYQHPTIRAKIEKQRKNKNSISYEMLNNKYTKSVSENTKIKRKNTLLQNQVQSLKQQLEAVYGELYKTKKSREYTK